ncbi:hypothetical protein FRC00_002844 [Tulasnella sp. 408]|nr:hypothetical protein FRC00_002844 [Tulasnella sp. 408]
MSLAATLDTTVPAPDRQPDWYLELLIASGNIIQFLVQSSVAPPNVESEVSDPPLSPILGVTPPGGGKKMKYTHALIKERGELVRKVLIDQGEVDFGQDYSNVRDEELILKISLRPFTFGFSGSVLLHSRLDKARLFGVSIKPRALGNSNITQIFSKMESEAASRERGLRFIHEAAFIPACTRCCEIATRADWDFRQYTLDIKGEEVQDD